MTHLGHSDNEAVGHIWDEAIDMNPQITVKKQDRENHEVKTAWSWIKKCITTQGRFGSGSLHFDKVPVFQYDVRVTLQRGVMAYTVVNWHASGKSDTCKQKESEWGGAESEAMPVSKAVQEKHWPFFMSFSLLKIFPVSVMMKASPFSQRLSTETPARAAPTIVFRASVEHKKLSA